MLLYYMILSVLESFTIFSILCDYVTCMTIIHNIISHTLPKFKIKKLKTKNKIREKMENKNKKERK